MSFIIAVDGGAASGKSSTSRLIADRFNLLHVDTGSHYRAVTFCLLQANLEASDSQNVSDFLDKVPLDTEVSGHRALIRINHYLPHETELRSEAVNSNVSAFAAIPAVRNFLLNYQHSQPDVAINHHFQGVIMEGRDIGSVIFPDASLRLFLEADPATRAARRAKEGQTDSIEKRDKMDSKRKTAPLVCPEGATRIDSSHMTLEEVVDHISQLIQEKSDLKPTP